MRGRTTEKEDRERKRKRQRERKGDGERKTDKERQAKKEGKRDRQRDREAQGKTEEEKERGGGGNEVEEYVPGKKLIYQVYKKSSRCVVAKNNSPDPRGRNRPVPSPVPFPRAAHVPPAHLVHRLCSSCSPAMDAGFSLENDRIRRKRFEVLSASWRRGCINTKALTTQIEAATMATTTTANDDKRKTIAANVYNEKYQQPPQ